MKSYSVFDIAEWFLQKESMTHKKLQKICYYAYAWCYALTSKELTNDTHFEAWIHGPVSPELYKKYKGNGWQEITPTNKELCIDSMGKEILESVWVTYGDMTGNALEALSHTEPPWISAREGLKDNDTCNNVISLGDIKKYYNSIYIGEDV